MTSHIAWESLVEAARNAREGAYAPYSNFKVGAAVLTDRGDVFSGANVENATYGATICAERVAIGSAISSGARGVTAVVIVTQTEAPTPPCGICRQVFVEFSPKCRVRAYTLAGKHAEWPLEALLPDAFAGDFLAKDDP